MSKVLKFIVHFCWICLSVCAIALLVPQFFGVTTVIMDNEELVTNLPMGSVTYAIPVAKEEIKIGDKILVQEENSQTYRYVVKSLDLANHTGEVVNSLTSNEKPITVSIREYLPKVVITIGLIGYLLAAFRTTEGLMIAGVVVLMLIILYILSEILRKDPSRGMDEDEEPMSRKERKRLEKEKAAQLKEEEERLRQEEKKNRKEAKKKKADKKMIRTGGFVDEIEDDEEPEQSETIAPDQSMQHAASEAHEVLKKEIAAATAEDEGTIQLDVPNIEQTRDVASEMKVQTVQEEPEEILSPEEIGKLAIPVLTASKLAEQAKRSGDNPELIRDDVTEVTLLDYSDIIAAEE